MTFYHGSSIGGLTELQPFVKPWSNLKEPLVYMTSSKQLAAHCIWSTEKYEIKSPMLDIRPDGTLVLQELNSSYDLAYSFYLISEHPLYGSCIHLDLGYNNRVPRSIPVILHSSAHGVKIKQPVTFVLYPQVYK